MPTQFTVTVDTEEEWDWNASWPITDLSVTNIMRLPQFQAICARHGAKVTYFTDQAVLDNPDSRSTILALSRWKEVEIGMQITHEDGYYVQESVTLRNPEDAVEQLNDVRRCHRSRCLSRFQNPQFQFERLGRELMGLLESRQ